MKSSLLLFAVLAIMPCAKAQVSTGTAFSVAPQLLVTNHHVITGCSKLSVVTPEGRRAASVVSAEASIDLALLRVFGMRGGAPKKIDSCYGYGAERELVLKFCPEFLSGQGSLNYFRPWATPGWAAVHPEPL